MNSFRDPKYYYVYIMSNVRRRSIQEWGTALAGVFGSTCYCSWKAHRRLVANQEDVADCFRKPDMERLKR